MLCLGAALSSNGFEATTRMEFALIGVATILVLPSAVP